MATTPTNLPVPSESPHDLKFNAGKIDEFVTSMGWTYTDRFGKKHYTIEGINYLAQQAMAAFGYVILTGKTFTTGATINNPNEVLLNTADGEYYKWTGSFAGGPKVVPENSTPASTGGIGPGAWIGVGDSSLRAALAQNKGSSLVGYGDRTVEDKLNERKSPFDFEAIGNGEYDDTLALQKFIDETDGDLDLAGGTFLISKNYALAIQYPNEADFSDGTYNYSPCLALVGKKGIKIHNGTLLVKTHGLDALSLIACEHVTVDLTIKGPGVFPAIDTTTGYAEKGEARFGYDSALVLAPNNALDTSAYTGGAYAGVTGQFPKYNADGSQASGWQNTWGKFLGGNIGSWACGVKVQRACRGILINDCDISGFNFGAVGIGIRNTAAAYGASDYTTDADVPDGVMVINTRIRKCYMNRHG